MKSKKQNKTNNPSISVSFRHKETDITIKIFKPFKFSVQYEKENNLFWNWYMRGCVADWNSVSFLSWHVFPYEICIEFIWLKKQMSANCSSLDAEQESAEGTVRSTLDLISINSSFKAEYRCLNGMSEYFIINHLKEDTLCFFCQTRGRKANIYD